MPAARWRDAPLEYTAKAYLELRANFWPSRLFPPLAANLRIDSPLFGGLWKHGNTKRPMVTSFLIV